VSDRYQILQKDFDSFFLAPTEAYGKDSPFVSQMKPDIRRFLSLKNPLFQSADDFSYFTLVDGRRPVGRIAVHCHRASNEKFNLKQAYFGYFDVINDLAAAKLLIERAQAWALNRGFTELVGNFNLTAMQQMGVMIDGFQNDPYIDFIWNAEHVPALLDQLSFRRDFFVNTFEVDINRVDLDRLLSNKARGVLDSDDYGFQELRNDRMNIHLEEIREILNDGFSQNPMFVPLSPEEMKFQAKDLSLIMDERITALIKYRGSPVGTIVAIPDLNPFLKATKSVISWRTPIAYWKTIKNRKRALLIFASVRHEQQSGGLSSAMLVHMIQALRKAGYEKLGITWVWDENKSVHVLMDRLGAKKLHRLCLFRKALV